MTPPLPSLLLLLLLPSHPFHLPLHPPTRLSPLHQTNNDPSKPNRVRSLASRFSKSVNYTLKKGGAPIAHVLKDAVDFQAVVGMERTLDRIEGELRSLRSEMDVLKRELLLHEERNLPREDTAPPVDYSTVDPSTLKYEDVDYTLTEMAAPFLNEDECLIPGEPVVRVEKAPQNSRRIFAGIDIPVSVEAVWKLLTDYPNLQRVVPNLVVNEVVQLLPGSNSSSAEARTDAERCKAAAVGKRGAILKQVGGAKVVGINFSARTTLEVREWPQGMPDFARFGEDVVEGKSRATRAKEGSGRELMRHVFPRPFALSSLPHRDISMQSIENDDGEFRMYQGVWRMQPLPGCSPPGGSAMRLTYAVEVSPRPYLPVALIEGRIAQDLCNNLKAIRDKATGG